MNYEIQGMQLNTIRVVRKGAVNDVFICRDLNSDSGSLYTLWVIKDHAMVKKLLNLFESEEGRNASCLNRSAWNGDFCMVFPYKTERSLRAFYAGDRFPLSRCEDICVNLILACMTEQVPYPILYLMLKQDQIHLAKDDTVFLSYQIDLSGLDTEVAERDCTVQCARILLELLQPKTRQKVISYTLLKKKVEKKSYTRFNELYKDIRVAAVPKDKRKLKSRVYGWFRNHGDSFFRIFLVLCILIVGITVITLATQMIFGEAPWMRIFTNSFRVIGTENLHRK